MKFFSPLMWCLVLLVPQTTFARHLDNDPIEMPPDILKGIYQPWTGPLAELKKTLRDDKNYVVWIHVPADHPLDLRTSEYFRRWFLATPLGELTISHNMIAFTCKDKNGQVKTGATGFMGQDNNQEIKMILKGYGVSMFFSTFTDGYLTPQKEVDEYIAESLPSRGAIFAGFEVSQAQCDNMQKFLSDFVWDFGRPFENFDLVSDPEKMEGGGCVTFAAALLKKAGQLETVIPQFYRTEHVARWLMGGNLEVPEFVRPNKLPWLKGESWSVSSQTMITNAWDTETESFPGFESLRLIDPEKMIYSLKAFAGVYMDQLTPIQRVHEEHYLSQTPLGQRIVHSGNNLITPGQTIYTDIPIDDEFEGMREIGEVSRSYFQQKVREGYKIRREKVAEMPVLLLEK